MRLVQGPDELESAYGTASLEAEAAFGDGSLYLEKAVSPARHVEIQVLGDGQGGVLTLGERECSIQRRHQKLIEESPSPALDDETREEMEAAARARVPRDRLPKRRHVRVPARARPSFYFIELNARLQVEHPVTELVTGIDLVREQLRDRRRRAARAHRPRRAPRARDRGADQRRGPDARLRAGARARSRASGRRSGRACASTRTSRTAPTSRRTTTRCSAKLIVWDETRPEAIARALRALGELELEGVPTTRELALDILRSEEFASGRYSTGFLEEAAARLPALAGS